METINKARPRARTNWTVTNRQTGGATRRIKNWRFIKSGLLTWSDVMGNRDDGMTFTLRTPLERRTPDELRALEAKVVAAIEAILEEEA